MLLRILMNHSGNIQRTMATYFEYARVLKKNRSKYVNRKTLLLISGDLECHMLRAIIESPVYSQQLPIKEFCRLVRVLLRYFLLNVNVLTLITSKKLPRDTQREHLERRREILEYTSKGFRI